MDMKLIAKFRNRWQSAERVKIQEVRNMPLREKFQQIVSLMCMAKGLKINFKDDNEVQGVRRRWAFLRRALVN